MKSPKTPKNLTIDELLAELNTAQKEQAESITELLGQDRPTKHYKTRAMEEWKYQYIARLLIEYTKRTSEGWRMYTPLPAAKPFHDSTTPYRLLVGSNRAGKTLTASAEVAIKAVTNPNKRILIVGKDTDHIGQVLWRKLSWAGENGIQIIRDEVTKKWRSVRPDPNDPSQLDPADVVRKDEWRPCPPLIPPRMIKKIAWENKALNVPRLVTLVNGTELWFRTSNGKPPNGVDLDGVWFDEELESSAQWYGECVMRLIDRGGWFLWSATPQVGNEELDNLYDDAENGAEWVSVYNLVIDDNPYMPAEQKAIVRASLHDEDEILVRYYGHRIRHSRRVYPLFSEIGVHGVDPFPIPQDWTRYLALDPGWQVCSAVLAAVPPDESELHIYKEFWLKNTTAEEVAAAIAEFVKNEPLHEAFIIDDQMGRQTNMITGTSFREHYRQAFEGEKLGCRIAGCAFLTGMSDVSARTEALRGLMVPNQQGTCKLKVHRGMCPNLVRNIKAAVFKKDAPDKRVQRDLHALDCLEYIAGFGPYYRLPAAGNMGMVDPVSQEVVDNLKRKKEKARHQLRRDSFWQTNIRPREVESILSRVFESTHR